MRKIIILLCVLFTGIAVAGTIDITWYNEDGTTYDTTTCNAGDTLVLPTAPTKRGYTFLGWSIYTPIEYIESTGTQWIDTGINRDTLKNYIMEIGVRWTNTAQRQLIGAQGYYYIGCINGFFQIALGGQQHTNVVALPNTKYNVSVFFDSTANKVNARINDVVYTGLPGGAQSGIGNVFDSTVAYANFAIFSLNDGYFAGSLRQYYYKLYQDDILVRDFIPVLDHNDVPCMYDKISQTCFYNAGTGDFIAGPVIGE